MIWTTHLNSKSMWKLERARPFYIMLCVYTLSFYVIPTFDFLGVISIAKISDTFLASYENFAEWVVNIVAFWSVSFYLERHRFRGDKMLPIIISLALFLFAYPITKLYAQTPIGDYLWRFVLEFSSCGLMILFYRLRYHNKISDDWYDIKKVLLAFLFFVVGILLIGIFRPLTDLLPAPIPFLLKQVPALIGLIFFLIHLKHLEQNEDVYIKT